MFDRNLLTIMPIRHDWNHMGNREFPIPLWFQLQLEELDPTLLLQYIPPSDQDNKGMPAERFPYGAWQICRKMKRTGWLHKLAVYSLLDKYGRYSPPTPAVLKVIRYAKSLWDHGEFTKMQDDMEKTFEDMAKASSTHAHETLVVAIQKFLSYQGKRQFHNRVFNAQCLN